LHGAHAAAHGERDEDLLRGAPHDVEEVYGTETIQLYLRHEGDPAPDGQGTLTLERGIEIGHIFQLGRKYTDAFDVQILDENGKRSIPTMGSYGIGVSRLAAVVVEQRHDDKGLNWPVEIAPYQVHVVVANKDSAAAAAAEEVAQELSNAGLDVLFDDRPGVAIAHATALNDQRSVRKTHESSVFYGKEADA